MITWCLLGCRIQTDKEPSQYKETIEKYQLDEKSIIDKFAQLEQIINKNAITSLNNDKQFEEMTNKLNGYKARFVPFDVLELHRLVKCGDNASQDIVNMEENGKKFVLLIGRTGAGKTTFILGCCGYRMVKKKYNGMVWVTT